MFIDTHCHLNFQAFQEDVFEVIQHANDAGVTQIIIPGAKIDSSTRAVHLSHQYPSCYAAVGVHPHHAGTVEDIPSALETLSSLADDPRVLAIGEIGLDQHQYQGYPPLDETAKTQQRSLLIHQLDIARQKDLPVIFHCRDAQDLLLDVLISYQHTHTYSLRAVFHCFDGDASFLKAVLSQGWYIGFDGNSTYPKNAHLRERIRETPLDRIVLETDSPYLPPVPHRGKRNTPAYIPLIAQLVSEIHGIPLKDVAMQTTKNAHTLFSLDHFPSSL